MADSLEFRRKFFAGNLLFLAIVALIIFAVFLLRDFLGSAKWDLTADKVYTISPATKDILSKLKDEVTVNYYCSEDLPGQLKTIKRDTKDLFDEFYELSNHKVNYSIIDPDEKASAAAEEKVRAYFEDKKAGKTPVEPEPPQSIQQMFSGKKAPPADEIRSNREKAAAMQAAQQKRPKDDVYRDILTEEFKRQYLQKLEQEGVGSFPYSEREASSVRQVRVFSSIEIKYLAKEPEVIPVHYQIESLEYELAQRILKLTTSDKPVVAFFDARKPAAPPPNPMSPTPPPQSDYEQITHALGEIFDVRSINLKEGDSLDDLIVRLKEDRFRKETEDKNDDEKKELEAKQDKTAKPEDLKRFIKCFVVAQPDQLEPRQVYEISRAVSLGVPTIFLASRYSMDISDGGIKQGIPLEMISPGVEELFRKWGIEIGHEVLASNEAGNIVLPRNMGGFRVMMPSPLSINVAATQDTIDQESPLTNRIPMIIFPASTGLKVISDTLKKNNLTASVLAKTTEESWSVKVDPFQKRNPFQPNAGLGATLSQYNEDLVQPKKPQEFRDFLTEPVPLAVYVQGKMPFAFEGETIPDWKKEDKEKDRGKGRPNPHAGIPGLQGIPGMPDMEGDEEADKDVALNAFDPQDAKDASKPAPAPATPPATPPATNPAPATPATPAPPAVNPAPPTPAAAPQAAPQAALQPAPVVQTAPAVPPPPAAPVAPVEKPKASVTADDKGQVLVLASVDMLKDDFLVQQTRDYQSNINFFYNAIENFGLGNQLIEIRRKQLTERRFKAGSDKSAGFIKWANTAGVPAIVGILGLFYFLWRRADSVAYERKFIQRQA